MAIEIRDIINPGEIRSSLEVIRASFRTVAEELGLTEGNCPAHASFITLDKLNELNKRAHFTGLYQGGRQVGFVAIEKADNGVYYLDKLSVLPQHRHKGYGKRLVEYVLTWVKEEGGSRVSLGMIDSHTVLKEWYEELGFRVTGTKKFDHLPFTVCFMDYSFSGEQVHHHIADIGTGRPGYDQ